MSRVRVVYLAHAFMVGGAEEMVLNLVRRLPARFEAIVCCIHEAGPIGEEMQRSGTRVDVLGLEPGLRRPFDIARLRAYLRSVRPDIVHTFLLTASLFGRLAAILARVPIVVGTEVNIYEHKRRSHAIAERMLMAGTDRVIVSAASVRDFYVGQIHADPAKVHVIYNAVDFSQAAATRSRDEMRAEIGVAADAPVAGMIARLTEQKGHRFLFDALASTPALANVHLIVIGGGELRDDLIDRAASLGISDRVHFLGPRRDLGNLLAAMDVFVMPSLWEGLPLSLVLAMGAGLPSVATAVAGIPEVVDEGATGLLVPAADVAALGHALARLFGDDRLRRQIGDAARISVLPRFGVDRYVTSVVDVYDELLKKVA
ncbi:MAG TPA: glycosyltransferase [Vicinamibacterales bacterium]|nr:glycosyltransferase [Vicinamibacterales bacterium]